MYSNRIKYAEKMWFANEKENFLGFVYKLSLKKITDKWHKCNGGKITNENLI